jgi:hypothetical protein
MAKRSRAVQTKTRLWEITVERSKEGTTSLDVVKAFKARFPELDQQEVNDLVDLGLMTLAGRVAVSNRPESGQMDIFSKRGYPEFVPIRVKAGSRSEVVRRDSKTVTPREYFSNDLVPSKHAPSRKKPSQRSLFHTGMEEMRNKQLLDMTLPDYLAQRDVD